MPTNRDMEYILRMRQAGFETIDAIKGRIGNLTKEMEKVKIGSERFNELSSEIRQASGAIDGARQKYEQYSSVSEKAGAFRREQIKDQRLQNFFFRESQQALGAVSLGLAAFNGAAGESSGKMNQLSNSLNQGFLAFQGLDFLVAGFAGPAGVAIAAIGGIGAALLSMNQQAEQSKIRVGELEEQIVRLRVEMGEASRQELLGILYKQLVQAGVKARELRSETFNWMVVLQQGHGALLKTVGTIEEIRAAELEIAKIEKAILDINNDITSDKEKQYQANVKGIEQLNEAVELWNEMELAAARMSQVQNISPEFAGLDTRVFDKALEEMKKKGLKLPEIISPDQAGSLNALNAELQKAEEELNRLQAGSEDWYQKLGETEEVKKKIGEVQARLEKALTDPIKQMKLFWAAAVPYIRQGTGLIAQAQAQRSEEQLNRIETEKEAALARIDAQLQDERLSEGERVALMAQRSALEEQYDAKTRAAKARAFAADKEAKTIQAIIDTASAVVEALPNFFLAALVAGMGAAQISLIQGQPTPKFHQGGTVGAGLFLDAPPHREIPVLARGGETFRTEAQEAELTARMRTLSALANQSMPRFHDGGTVGRGLSLAAPSTGGVQGPAEASPAPAAGGTTVIINFNAPTTDVEFIRRGILKALRETNLPLDQVFVNNRSNLKLAR